MHLLVFTYILKKCMVQKKKKEKTSYFVLLTKPHHGNQIKMDETDHVLRVKKTDNIRII
jgi:hypothetical protein